MKAFEALALIDELTEIAMDDSRATKRAGRERQKDLERAREICTKLASNCYANARPTGVPGPPGAAGPGAVRVVDSQGKAVGSYDSNGVSFIKLQDVFYAVNSDITGPVASRMPSFKYESDMCEGTPYWGARASLAPAAYFSGGTLYYPTGTAQQRVIASFIMEGACQSQTPVTLSTVDIGTTEFSSLGFTPPFHLEQWWGGLRPAISPRPESGGPCAPLWRLS
jgi:hypothetical protein